MNRIRRHIAIFSLLLTAALPVLLSIAFLLRIHAAEKAKESHATQTISLKASDLHWIKPGKEIKIGNLLFDVQNIQQQGEQFLITGHFDTREDRLLDQAGRMMKMPDAGPVFSLPPLFNDIQWMVVLQRPCTVIRNIMITSAEQLPDSPFMLVPTPPPSPC